VSKVSKVPKDDLFILLTGFAPSLCRSPVSSSSPVQETTDREPGWSLFLPIFYPSAAFARFADLKVSEQWAGFALDFLFNG